MKNQKGTKVHIHRVVQTRLEARGFKKGGVFAAEYEKVKRLYGRFWDENMMIDTIHLSKTN